MYVLKYQPYRGYGGGKPWLWYGAQPFPRRIRTRGDWHYDLRPRTLFARSSSEPLDPRARFGLRHCSGGSRYRKRLAHRTFRHRATLLLRAHLAHEHLDDFPASHHLRYCGDWLD